MTVRFLRVISYIIAEHEGGDANHPADPGKRTRYGIAEASHPHVWAKPGGPTLDDALRVYWEHYWLAARCGDFTHQALGAKVFDLAILRGVPRTIRMLQDAYNLLATPTMPLSVDGRIGPTTLAAVNGYRHPRSLVFLLGAMLADHMRASQNAPSFLAGWIWRSGWNGEP